MFISPMLLNKVNEPFNDIKFISEMKLDGIRLILSKFNGEVRIYSRHRNDVTNKFKELQNIEIPEGTAIDGEVIVTDSNGKPCFESMMERFMTPKKIHRIQYCVFDIMYYKSENVMFKPLIERKMLLESILPQKENVVMVQHINGRGIEYFNAVKEKGLEGIVLKKSDSVYRASSRSNDWLKIINYQYANIIITGLRKKKFGVLLSFDDGSPAGILEFMKPIDRKILYEQYKKYKQYEDENNIYLNPELRGIVKYRNLTRKGYLRIPSFERWIS
ncbi:ATP-dependent DNA ligase [Cytobacillus horneckiae]|uniref:ATP-dependent DNA ligase n=1 Tax=Cytobacillus horneckiae TaxID=549687 RepID=UPI003D22CF25